MSLNRATLIGHVGRDPELQDLGAGKGKIARLSLATTERGYKTDSGVAIPDRTEWHNVVLWKGLATLAENYIRKGMQIYVEGKIRTSSYTDKSGNTRYKTEIIASAIDLLGRRGETNATATTGHDAPVKAYTMSAEQAVPQQEQQGDLPF